MTSLGHKYKPIFYKTIKFLNKNFIFLNPNSVKKFMLYLFGDGVLHLGDGVLHFGDGYLLGRSLGPFSSATTFASKVTDLRFRTD